MSDTPRHFASQHMLATRDLQPGDADQSGSTLVIDGVVCLPGHSLKIGTPNEGDRLGFVHLLTGWGGGALYLGLSPDFAREVAASLCEAADIAEQHLAAAADQWRKP